MLSTTHANGFGASIEPFPDDDGGGSPHLSIVPVFPTFLSYNGTLTTPLLGTSTAATGGSYSFGSETRSRPVKPLGTATDEYDGGHSAAP